MLISGFSWLFFLFSTGLVAGIKKAGANRLERAVGSRAAPLAESASGN
jgi:hypothetical protein